MQPAQWGRPHFTLFPYNALSNTGHGGAICVDAGAGYTLSMDTRMHEDTHRRATRAVVFDMDGIILDSGEIWQGIIATLFADCDTGWDDIDEESFAGGDNSQQWASFLRHTVGLPLEEEEIIARVTAALIASYERRLPLVPGAETIIADLAACYPLGRASSSPRPVIAFVLERSGLDRYFTAWVSSDDVARGKPAPDVYLKACHDLGMEPERCVAVEDSRFGIQAARAAHLKVVAIPQPHLALAPGDLALADRTLGSLAELRPEVISSL
jgi:HAD superfamily hydrolase (TIGR01509 family)